MNPAHSACLAIAHHPPPEPVPAVSYTSRGRLLVVGDATALQGRLEAFAGREVVTVPGLDALRGWLGAFEARWRDATGGAVTETFDLVLDLGAVPSFTMFHPPQGYFAPRDDAALQAALEEIEAAVGEFEKPKFFLYDDKTCAHSRAGLTGCERCLTTCSTQAIEAAGDGIRVEPHLCMGCGACATVCPSGAVRYNYPSVRYWGGRLRATLHAYAEAGGTDACLLFHRGEFPAESLPERVIPLEMHDVAATGPDLMLGALALGANRVAVLVEPDMAPQYRAALHEQMQWCASVLQGLGYGGGHLHLIETPQELAGLPPARVPERAAEFHLFDRKRDTLEACIAHFVRHAPQPPAETLALPAGAPFGTVEVAGGKCTLCYACVTVCPNAALRDGAGEPSLRFVERDCVQCGLCMQACPEDAIRLVTRLDLRPEAKRPRVVRQDAPFHCVRCGKPFASAAMVAGVVARLDGHVAFATPQARARLQMCGDCRLIDMLAGEAVPA